MQPRNGGLHPTHNAQNRCDDHVRFLKLYLVPCMTGNDLGAPYHKPSRSVCNSAHTCRISSTMDGGIPGGAKARGLWLMTIVGGDAKPPDSGGEARVFEGRLEG